MFVIYSLQMMYRIILDFQIIPFFWNSYSSPFETVFISCNNCGYYLLAEKVHLYRFSLKIALVIASFTLLLVLCNLLLFVERVLQIIIYTLLWYEKNIYLIWSFSWTFWNRLSNNHIFHLLASHIHMYVVCVLCVINIYSYNKIIDIVPYNRI
jgi:hypothetical protein